MILSDYDYKLPDERIAQEPATERDGSRLMVLKRQERLIRHARFQDLADYLRPGDCLVINETRVFPARLQGFRPESGGLIELLLLRKEGELWEAMVRPGRRLGEGAKVVFPNTDLTAVVKKVCSSGHRLLWFDGSEPLEKVLARCGKIPLPPYIRRECRPEDKDRYQTVYARTVGAVAAPTAGLHFTVALLDELKMLEVKVVPVLLHVGVGTFKPISAKNPSHHKMGAEFFRVGTKEAETINKCREQGGRIVAVGTTSVRTLESAAVLEGNRWILRAQSGLTSLFIYPAYSFRFVDALITNFHLPRSTLLMLVSAFADRTFILEAYYEAISQKYQFYSYGDAMLIQ